jgi:hypothetical protein
MSVYFAKVGRFIKVGESDNPVRRVQRLRSDASAKPFDLDRSAPVELLHVVEDADRGEEFQAHAALACFRVCGEWFLDVAPVRAYMTSGSLEASVERTRREARQWRRRRRRRT